MKKTRLAPGWSWDIGIGVAVRDMSETAFAQLVSSVRESSNVKIEPSFRFKTSLDFLQCPLQHWVLCVMADFNLWLTAENLIKNHGQKAAMEAAMIADKMGKRGDTEGRAAWVLITNAVRELENRSRGH